MSHGIPLVDDIPIWERYRRIPPTDYDAVKHYISQLLENHIIKESSSPYASPIVIVTKKDGQLRMCVDYRRLNNKSPKDAFPLLRIKESPDAFNAFCTPFGLFEFNRMAFGLCNALSTFQRLMERMFVDQRYQSLLLYLDKVVVLPASQTTPEVTWRSGGYPKAYRPAGPEG